MTADSDDSSRSISVCFPKVLRSTRNVPGNVRLKSCLAPFIEASVSAWGTRSTGDIRWVACAETISDTSTSRTLKIANCFLFCVARDDLRYTNFYMLSQIQLDELDFCPTATSGAGDRRARNFTLHAWQCPCIIGSRVGSTVIPIVYLYSCMGILCHCASESRASHSNHWMYGQEVWRNALLANSHDAWNHRPPSH